MSILVFKFRRISRTQTRTVIAAAAYRSGTCLYDERKGREVDFTDKGDVVHSSILVPKGAEHLAEDRAAFWNAVDRRETRRDALLAYDFIASLPPALSHDDHLTVARGFAKSAFVDAGLGVDLNIHAPLKAEGLLNPHAHLMVTTRTLALQSADDDLVAALDQKIDPKLRHLIGWRIAFAEHANAKLAERDIDQRVDPRSFKKQGLQIEPRFRLSISSRARLVGGRPTAQGLKILDVAGRNGDRIIAEPLMALRAISREQIVFTEQELRRFLGRHAEDATQLDLALARVLGDPSLVDLGRDAAGVRCFASKEEVALEASVIEAGKGILETGRLKLHDTVAPREVIASAERLDPGRTINVLMPSPDDRRDFSALGGPTAMSAADAQAMLQAGGLDGQTLVITNAHRLRPAALEPFMAAAGRDALVLHLAGAPADPDAAFRVGTAFRALQAHAARAPTMEAHANEDRCANADFARRRGLSGGETAQALSTGLGPRRRREADQALEQRRAVLHARKNSLEREGRSASDAAPLERRLAILKDVPEPQPTTLEL
jgi:hypothetical protein